MIGRVDRVRRLQFDHGIPDLMDRAVNLHADCPVAQFCR